MTVALCAPSLKGERTERYLRSAAKVEDLVPRHFVLVGEREKQNA
jgi:hypothetical protein